MSDIEQLSDDAKSVAAAFFPNMNSHVTFHMEASGPSARSQAALDELVAAGVATKVVHNKRTGAATYRPLTDCSALTRWQMKRLLSGELEANSFNLWERLDKTETTPETPN